MCLLFLVIDAEDFYFILFLLLIISFFKLILQFFTVLQKMLDPITFSSYRSY